MTSEERFDIVKQPEDTCPLIDDVLRDLDKVSRYCTEAEYYAERLDTPCKNLNEALSEISWHIPSTDSVEAVRHRVTEIRNWGQEWKDKALELQSELDFINLQHVKGGKHGYELLPQ